MTEKEIFSLASILLGFGAMVPYLVGIARRRVKPHMFSWFIWSVVCMTGGVAQLKNGGGPGSWLLIVNSITNFMIAVLAFWWGTRDIKRVDGVVLVVALSAIPVWVVTENALWAVLIAISIDTLAYAPTIRKSWRHPEQESLSSWAISTVVFMLSILGLQTYSLTTWLYPLTFAVINGGFAVFLIARRRQLGL